VTGAGAAALLGLSAAAAHTAAASAPVPAAGAPLAAAGAPLPAAPAQTAAAPAAPPAALPLEAGAAWNRYAAAAAWSFSRNGYGASGGIERALWSPRPWLHAVAGGHLTYLRFFPFRPVAGLQAKARSATVDVAAGALLGRRQSRFQVAGAVFAGLQRFMRDDRLLRPDLQIDERLTGSEWTARSGWRLLLHGRVAGRLWLLLGVESAFSDLQVSHLTLGASFVP
jgi:hypothetical protein